MALALVRGKSNYAYAVARVQAKRAKLIPPSEFDKILKMDVAEITRYIQESAYKTEVDELASKFSGLDLLEAALTVNEERTYESIRGMVAGGGGALITAFLDRYHYDDLKTLIRGKLAGASREELLREMVLENAATYELFAPLLADDVKTVADLIAALERIPGEAREWANVLRKVPADAPQARFEEALDKAYFARLMEVLETSRESEADKVLEFVRREIDTVNLLNAARWVQAGEKGDFSPFVVPGGKHLKVADVVGLARSPDLAAFAETLGGFKPFAGLVEALSASRKANRLSPFQGAVWRLHLADLDRLAHANPLSVVPILFFLLRKHREVVVLRAVARGKAAGLSEARLQELIL
jgi:V/A-type H+-transporting ATPase subunit C